MRTSSQQAINALPAAAAAVGCVLLNVLLPHDDRYVLPSLPLCFYLVMPKWFSDAARRSVVVVMVATALALKALYRWHHMNKISGGFPLQPVWDGDLGYSPAHLIILRNVQQVWTVSPWFHQLVASLFWSMFGNIPKIFWGGTSNE